MGPGFESLRVYFSCCIFVALLAQLVEQLTLINGSRVRVPEGVLLVLLFNYNPFLLWFRKVIFILLSVTPARCRSHDSKRYSTVFNLQPAGYRYRATPAIVRRHIRVTVATNGFELSTFPVVEIRIVRKKVRPMLSPLPRPIRPKSE